MTPEAAKPETKKPANPAAKKKAPSKDINKSAEIRKIASGMKAKGQKPRPKTIIEMLKKEGIAVSSPQVSMVLKKMGFRPRKRRKIAVGSERSAGPATKKTGKVKVEDLVKAQKIASQMGGIDKALAALQALKAFEG